MGASADDVPVQGRWHDHPFPALFDLIAQEYGWTDEQILATRFARLRQIRDTIFERRREEHERELTLREMEQVLEDLGSGKLHPVEGIVPEEPVSALAMAISVDIESPDALLDLINLYDPDITIDDDPIAYTLIIYKAAKMFAQQFTRYSYKSRAFGESFGDKPDLIIGLLDQVYALENSGGMSS